MDRPIASDLSYLVLKKRRKESEHALLQSHQSHQGAQLGFSGSVVIPGSRFLDFLDAFGAAAELAARHESADSLDLVSLWHVHGKR